MKHKPHSTGKLWRRQAMARSHKQYMPTPSVGFNELPQLTIWQKIIMFFKKLFNKSGEVLDNKAKPKLML